MIAKQLPALDLAINEESWLWLDDNVPLLARAVQTEVKRGASAAQIKRYVIQRTGREAIALRCEQAAAFLAAQNEEAVP